MKRTQWFAKDVRPIHIGVYEVKSPYPNNLDSIWMRYWNGEEWRIGYKTIHAALRARDIAGIQDCQWRGLKENPHAD